MKLSVSTFFMYVTTMLLVLEEPFIIVYLGILEMDKALFMLCLHLTLV